MVKLVYVIGRREDVAPEEFHRYWLEEHGPKVRSVAEAMRARRYVQTHILDTHVNAALLKSRGMAGAYDGIAELWWDNLFELRAGSLTPEGVEAGRMLIADEAKFIDFARSTMFVAEEHEIFDRRPERRQSRASQRETGDEERQLEVRG
jgi:hypothetical protein